jgi:hypothetical protein
VRPRIERRDFNSFIDQLNEMETSKAGKWRLDSSELASAAKFSDQDGKLAASGLSLDAVASELRGVLLKETNSQPRVAGAL